LLADTLKTFAFSAALPALEETQGYIVAISSIGAQLRFPGASDGCISKYAINRLVEFIALGKTIIPYFFVFSRRLMM
jgi:NAD(P)-dependent dehydrogenase (short-subunit alcohol dehydrogenase family)